MKLEGKVVVITGSTRGIGRAVAEACAREGARVVVCSRRWSAVQQTIHDLRQGDFGVSGLPVDVAVPGDLEKLFQHTLDTWGRLDVWINNAGLSGGFRSLHEMAPEEIQAVVDTNLTGTLLASCLVIPHFREHGGILINVSGKGGRGEANPFLATYGATKVAVASLTRSLARENRGSPLSIHVVLPGMVETDLYRYVKTGPGTADALQSLPYVLKAVGVPIAVVSRLFVEIAAQEPGKTTGRVYSLFKGRRLLRGLALLMWYRATGKIKGT